MRVFVTGATGFIGSAIVRDLIAAGHQVLGLTRSDKGAQKLAAAGAEAHRGALDDLDSLRSGAATADGVIHTAFIHGLSGARPLERLRILFGGRPSGIVGRFLATALSADQRAIEALGGALAGSDRPLVVACGTMALTPGRLATEDDAADPASPGGLRGASEELTLSMASRGVRASVIRLAPSVHGDGDTGFLPFIIAAARKKKVAPYVGDGRNHWPAVHRLDAARLFRLALEQGAAGARYHGVAEEGVPMRAITEVIGRRLNVPVTSITPTAADRHFSWLASFVANDNLVSSKLTRERLGWQPQGPGLIADLDRPTYFKV